MLGVCIPCLRTCADRLRMRLTCCVWQGNLNVPRPASSADQVTFTAQFWSQTCAHYMCCGSRLRESHSVMPTSCMTPFTGKTNLSSVDKLIFVMQMLATKPALGEKECATMPATMVH